MNSSSSREGQKRWSESPGFIYVYVDQRHEVKEEMMSAFPLLSLLSLLFDPF